jgi:dTDP-4-dehydrorhamnose 3,5-epimerase
MPMERAEAIETILPGVKLVRASALSDARGSFTEILSASGPLASLGTGPVVQVNLSESERAGTVRGMHWQAYPHGQDKLVYCMRGRVFDVAIDVRQGSSSRCQYIGVHLSEDEPVGLFVPSGFAHGWQALTDRARILYVVFGASWTPASERGTRFDDEAVRIGWPIPVTLVSDRDRTWPSLAGVSSSG